MRRRKETIGMRVRRFLERKGLSKGGFSIKIGESRDYISNIKSTMSLKSLARLAEELPDLNTRWLITGVGDMIDHNAYDKTIPVSGYPYLRFKCHYAQALMKRKGILFGDFQKKTNMDIPRVASFIEGNGSIEYGDVTNIGHVLGIDYEDLMRYIELEDLEEELLSPLLIRLGDSNVKIDFGLVLKTAKEKNITIADLVEKSNLQYEEIGTYSQGLGKIIPQDMTSIVKALGEGHNQKAFLVFDKEEVERLEPVRVEHDHPQGIPLLSIAAVGGLNGMPAIDLSMVEEYYYIPKISADFMLPVAGDSMKPRFHAGDVIACRMIDAPSFYQWGQPHVLGSQTYGVILKRIRKSDKGEAFVRLVSDNPDYDDMDVPWDDIHGVAIVVAGAFRT